MKKQLLTVGVPQVERKKMTKQELRGLVKKYFIGDNHKWPSWMGYDLGDSDVRYDYDSSKQCYSLIRHFKPTNCFEVGSSFGHSTIFITDALLKNGKPFKFVSFELEESIWRGAKKNLVQRHGKLIPNLICGDITENLNKVPKEIDFAFIDTNHEAESTKWYVENIFPRLKDGALVAIHDFAVEVLPDGTWNGKGADGHGGLPETQVLMDLHKEGKLPLEPLYWNYHNPLFEGDNPGWEASFWIYRKPE